MAYGLSHRLRFYDYWGDLVDVQISKRDYSGSSVNLTGTWNSVIMKLESEESGVSPGIRGSVVDINIRATSLNQYDDFLNFDNRMYKVDVYVDSALVMGDLYIDPENSSRPNLVLYEMNLKASTGVGYLRKIQFKQSNGNLYRSRKTLYSCLYTCLLHIDSAPKIYDAIDIFGTSDHSTSPLTKEYLDPRGFKIKWNKAWTCYDVINEILRIKNARMFKYRDGWYILPADYSDDTINIRVLTGSDGTQSATLSNVQMRVDMSNGTVSEANMNVPIDKSVRLYNEKMCSKVIVSQNKGYKNSLFDPWYYDDFILSRSVDSTPSFGYSISQENEEIVLQHLQSPTDFESDWIQYKLAELTTGGRQTVSAKLMLTEVNVQTRVRMFIRTATGTVYLSKQGDWLSTPTWLLLTDEDDEGEVIGSRIDVVGKPITDDGDLYIEFAIRETSPSATYYSTTDPKYTRIKLSDIDISLANNQYADEEKIFELEGSTDAIFIDNTIQINYGDLENDVENNYYVYTNGLYQLVDGEYNQLTTFYSTKTETIAASMPMVQMLAHRYMLINSRIRKRLSAHILAHFNPITLPVLHYKVYMMNTFEYDMRSCVWLVTAFEVADNSERELLLETGVDLLLETEDAILLE